MSRHVSLPSLLRSSFFTFYPLLMPWASSFVRLGLDPSGSRLAHRIAQKPGETAVYD
jgi:hypothetical protein